MAVQVKRVEKDFFLRMLYFARVPVVYLENRREYIFFLERPAGDEMIFRPKTGIGDLQTGSKMRLMFDYWGRVIIFSVKLRKIVEKSGLIICDTPQFLYRELARSYSRVSVPLDMEIKFSFQEDISGGGGGQMVSNYYNLSFPMVSRYEIVEAGKFIEGIDPANLSGLISQMTALLKKHVSGCKFIIFKNETPENLEERVVAETGKALFFPSMRAGFPETDPYPRKRIITGELFQRFLESTGVNLAFVREECDRFVKSRYTSGIRSEALVPILFQEYVIGYIHAWINEKGKPLFDYELLDTLYQFAKMLAYSLKINGFYNQRKKCDFAGKTIDIAVSGILFSYPNSSLSSALLLGNDISICISTPRRTIHTKAKIVRHYRDAGMSYFGCRFQDMSMEDTRFLFEAIYGKPFTDTDAKFLAGNV
jgi:hypothetical protein